MENKHCSMLVRIGHTPFQVLGIQHRCHLGLGNFLKYFLCFLVQMKARGSIFMSKCQVFDTGSWGIIKSLRNVSLIHTNEARISNAQIIQITDPSVYVTLLYSDV